MSAFGHRANFREKTRERAVNFVECRCTARAEFDRRALHSLGNTHDVGKVCVKVILSFSSEIARCRRLEIAQGTVFIYFYVMIPHERGGMPSPWDVRPLNT